MAVFRQKSWVNSMVAGRILSTEISAKVGPSLFCLGLIGSFNPYYFWGFWQFKGVALFAYILSIFICVDRGVSRQSLYVSLMLLCVFLYWSLPGEKGIFVIPVLSIAGIVSVLLLSRSEMLWAVNLFFKLLALLLIPGLVLYFLILFNVDIPYESYYLMGKMLQNLVRFTGYIQVQYF